MSHVTARVWVALTLNTHQSEIFAICVWRSRRWHAFLALHNINIQCHECSVRAQQKLWAARVASKMFKGKALNACLSASIILRNRYQSSPCVNCNYLQSLFGCTFIGVQMQIAKPRSKPHDSSARGRMCNCKVRLFRNRLLHAKPSSRQRDANEGQWFHSSKNFLQNDEARFEKFSRAFQAHERAALSAWKISLPFADSAAFRDFPPRHRTRKIFHIPSMETRFLSHERVEKLFLT